MMKKITYFGLLFFIASCVENTNSVEQNIFHPNLKVINTNIRKDTGLDFENFKSIADKKIDKIDYNSILISSMEELDNETLGSVFDEVRKVNGDSISDEEIDSLMLQVSRNLRKGIGSDMFGEYFQDRITYIERLSDTVYRHNTGEFDECIYDLSKKKMISEDEMGYLLVTNHILSMLYNQKHRDWAPLGSN